MGAAGGGKNREWALPGCVGVGAAKMGVATLEVGVSVEIAGVSGAILGVSGAILGAVSFWPVPDLLAEAAAAAAA